MRKNCLFVLPCSINNITAKNDHYLRAKHRNGEQQRRERERERETKKENERKKKRKKLSVSASTFASIMM